MALPWTSESEDLSRAKRFVYNAKSTCGYIAYCSPDIHRPELALNTSLADDPNCSKGGLITSIIYNILMGIFIVFGNLMIIYIMTTNRKFHNPQGVFKTSLAIFDFVVGAIIIPSNVYNKIRIMFVPLGKSYLQYLVPFTHAPISIFFGMLFSICISGSLFSLLALTIDRLMAVHWPFKYQRGKMMTSFRAIIVVVGIWVLCTMLGVLAMGDKERFYYDLDYMTMSFMLEVRVNPSRQPPNLRHGFFFMVLVFIIPYVCVVLVTAITWLMFWWNRRKARKEKQKSMAAAPRINVTTVAGPEVRIHGADQEEKTVNVTPAKVKVRSQKSKVKLQSAEDKDLERLTIIMVIMVACFTVCVLPFLAIQTDSITPRPGELEHIKKYGRRFSDYQCKPAIHVLVLELLYLNSLCNFIIYNLRNEAFRKGMQNALRKIFGLFRRE